MRVYMAAMYLPRAGDKDILPSADGYEWDLESYHYMRDLPKILARLKERKRSVFLDSGAFTMFRKNIVVDLGQYAAYIKSHKDHFHVASNLDEIGAGKEDVTWNNQKILERMGAMVQPVFHARDDDKWLEKYIAEGYDYIFLGGMVPESTKYLREWLDHVFGKYFTRKDGTAKIKVHGFGLTTFSLMRRYPWFSVDSTSWLMTAMYGGILLDLPHGITTMQISEKSNRNKDWDMHYDTLSPVKQGAVDTYIRGENFDPLVLRKEYSMRCQFNLAFFKKLSRHPDPVFRARRQAASLFS